MDKAIDFVVLWVDGADPAWQAQRAQYCPDTGDNGNDPNRYRDWDLMRYWFRGVEAFAPWVNRVFFVTCGQAPDWLDTTNPKLRLVHHRDYIPAEFLPTFNSNVIELWLHNIPDLSEHFVLFNDDMFLTAPVKPTDFFVDGLPVESALLEQPGTDSTDDCLPHMLLNNSAILNKHFRKKSVLRQHARKFFTPKYGKDLLRNVLLAPFQFFSAFRDPHLPSAYRKSTFREVWQAEEALLLETSTHRFRSKGDLTHWLMKGWQFCKGQFQPRSTRWGRHYELWEDNIETIYDAITHETYRVVCLNDSKSDIDFDHLKERLNRSFEMLLPEPSSFEREEL